ncbi:MAG: glutamyl-tRNA reductase [Chthoniobacterales bacterium]|nr:MAG: glutamyl-tRNA reductase [Chthoniobacterales bacterium]
MKLFCVGLNHRTAPIEARERFAGHGATTARLRECGCGEALLLTTCNRVEVYAARERDVAIGDIAAALQTRDCVLDGDELAPFYRHEGPACAHHLFRVASGLDSMVVGETEIFGQVKRAYEQARAAGEASALLHRLFQRAFRVAKQVRSRTEITRGSVSVGSVAVELAEKIFGDLRGRKVLVLGAGETSEKTLRALASRGVSDLRVSNRTPARAEGLAAELEGIPVPFSNWLEQCREIDILISSTAADTHLLTPETLMPVIRERIDRPLFLIDIAVPRDIAPEVNKLDGVYLYDIDSLRSIASKTLELRRQQVAAAEAIIDEHVADFAKWLEPLVGGATCAQRREATVAAALRTSEL